MHMQGFQADIMLATSLNLCAQVLASKLDKAFINYIPAGPIDPFFTTIYPNSNRRAFMPNPLSYVPQAGDVTPSQRMVRGASLLHVLTCLRSCQFRERQPFWGDLPGPHVCL